MKIKKYQWGGWNNNWGNVPVDPSDPSYTYNTLLQSGAPFANQWHDVMRDLELNFQTNAPGAFDQTAWEQNYTTNFGPAPTATSYQTTGYQGINTGKKNTTTTGYTPSWGKATNNNTGFQYNGIGSGNLGQINPAMSYSVNKNAQLEAAKKDWEKKRTDYVSGAQNAMKFIGPIGALLMGNKGEEAYKSKPKDNLNPELGFYGFNYQNGGYAPPESQGINYLTKPESEKDRLIREKLEREKYRSQFGKRRMDSVKSALDVASAIPVLGRAPAAMLAGMNMSEGDYKNAALNFLTSITGKTLGQEEYAMAKFLNKAGHVNHNYHKAHLLEKAQGDTSKVSIPYVDTSTIQRRDNTLLSSFQSGGYTNLTGYTPGFQTFNNPYNIIPSNNISLKNTPFPLMGIGNNGQSKVMVPGNDYKFPGASSVLEIPLKQDGGFSEELDLNLDQIMELRKQGYKVEVQ